MKKYLLLSCVLLTSLFMQAARIDGGTRATDNVILTGNEDFQKCDVDGNGVVDMADVEEVVKIIMGTSNNPNGDVTGEGKVNAADIVEIVNIMKALGSGMGYFWIGTYIPTYNHFPPKEEIVTTYKSITEALANAPSFNVEKGQYLVILCPSSWNVNINDIVFQDNTSGKIYTMLKHYTGIVNHNEYETTDKIDATTTVTLKTKAEAEAYLANTQNQDPTPTPTPTPVDLASMTDNDIAATLQGTWSVVQYYPEDGETKTTGKKETWTFSGNLVHIYVTSTFTISNGIMYADAVDGAIILTKLTSTEFEGYWNEYPGEKYYGVRQ